MAKLEYGWFGKVLWIDLAAKTTKEIDVSDYCEEYVGGRGLAARLAWDYVKPGTKAFDEGNHMMFLCGPVTGAPAFGAGRGYAFCVGASTYPEHFTRSGMGGRWATSMKSCGYDGIILANKSAEPVFLEVKDDVVTFHDATKYWGRTINDMDVLTREDFGHDAFGFYIGPTGEKKIRCAAIMNNTGHACGQGGFGAVMGDKKVKGVIFNGSKSVKVADPQALYGYRQDAYDHIGLSPAAPVNAVDFAPFAGASLPATEHIAKGDISYASLLNTACTGCGARCWNTNTYYRGLQGRYLTNPHIGSFKCADAATLGWPAKTDLEMKWYTEKLGRTYRWPLDLRAGLEVNAICNNYGMNTWEIQTLLLWLTELEMENVNISELLGMEWNVDDPTLLPRLTEMMALGEGCGEWLGEGMARGGEKLGGIYKKFSSHVFNGYPTHAIGTDSWWNYYYPYYVPVVLEYAVDSRDPVSDSAHQYIFSYGGGYLGDDPINFEGAKAFYGKESAVGPYYYRRKSADFPDGDLPEETFEDMAYMDKELVAHHNIVHGIIIGCGVLCDRYYPIFDDKTGGTPYGNFEIESQIISAVTGKAYSNEKMYEIALKVYNMERVFAIMETARDKDYDISVLDNIHPRGDWTYAKKIDAPRFEAMLDRYYALEGWDANGCPTEETLKKYGLDMCIEALKSRK